MFIQDDLAKHRAFRTILDKCKLDLNGDAMIIVASLFSWYDQLASKIESAIEKPKPVQLKAEDVKPIEKSGSIKKIGDK